MHLDCIIIIMHAVRKSLGYNLVFQSPDCTQKYNDYARPAFDSPFSDQISAGHNNDLPRF